MERRKISMTLLGVAGIWIAVSAMAIIYAPGLEKPDWMQVADILVIAAALIIVFLELEMGLRADQSES